MMHIRLTIVAVAIVAIGLTACGGPVQHDLDLPDTPYSPTSIDSGAGNIDSMCVEWNDDEQEYVNYCDD